MQDDFGRFEGSGMTSPGATRRSVILWAMSDKTVISWHSVARTSHRILLTLFLTLGAAVSLSVATQHAALASGCLSGGNGTYAVAFGCDNVRIPAAHHCMEVAHSSNGQTEGIECADLYVTNDANQEMWGEGEFYCQGASPQCLGKSVTIWASAKDNGSAGPADTEHGGYACTTSGCPNGGQARVSTAHFIGLAGCIPTYSFEPKDGATINGVINHEIIKVNGAPEASHAGQENDSARVTVCFN